MNTLGLRSATIEVSEAVEVIEPLELDIITIYSLSIDSLVLIMEICE